MHSPLISGVLDVETLDKGCSIFYCIGRGERICKIKCGGRVQDLEKNLGVGVKSPRFYPDLTWLWVVCVSDCKPNPNVWSHFGPHKKRAKFKFWALPEKRAEFKFVWLSKSCVIVQTTLLWLYWHCVTVQMIVWFVQGPLTNTQCWNFRWASRAVAMNCFEWLSKSCVIVQTTLLWLYWHCVTVQGIVWFSNFAGKSDTFIWLVVSTFWLALSDCPRVVWLSELHSCDCIGIVWLSKWLCDCPRSPY